MAAYDLAKAKCEDWFDEIDKEIKKNHWFAKPCLRKGYEYKHYRLIRQIEAKEAQDAATENVLAG